MRQTARGEGLPKDLQLYLDHACGGVSLRAIARREGLAASTVLRQVRRIETRRDDPLLDDALKRLETSFPAFPPEEIAMTSPLRTADLPNAAELARDGLKVLRSLSEPGAVLAIVPDFEKAAVLRRLPDGGSARSCVLERRLAEGFLLQDWIVLSQAGRPALYVITTAGRAALKRLSTGLAPKREGFAEAQSPFAGQHQIWAEKTVAGEGEEGPRRLRYNLAESPVAALGRRRDKDGVPFLTPDLVEAAERLREDFELAQMGPRIAQNWERFLTGPSQGGFGPGRAMEGGSSAARERVARALRDLGPGLGDMVLRCCCHLEGLEAAEKRLGWSARSGKIVLRIALQRLKRHYAETYGGGSPLIG